MAVVQSRRRFLLLRRGGGVPTPSASRCLSSNGTVCRTCGERCEAGAIRFTLLPGGRAFPLIDEARCNACGECSRVCPVGAFA